MKRNKMLYLIAAIGFDVAALASFLNYFMRDKSSITWLILGCASLVISLPMIISFKKEKS